MTKTPPQRPEGALIEGARLRQSPRLSGRKAAEMAGISEGRWRHIVKGYQTVKAGLYVEIQAPADTLGRMAHVVGVTAKELREVGRNDAADWLDNMLGANEDSPPVEITRIDVDGFEAFQAAVEGTPPHLRDLAMALALKAVEAVQETDRNAPAEPKRGD